MSIKPKIVTIVGHSTARIPVSIGKTVVIQNTDPKTIKLVVSVE
jgi:hypothetical protein